MNNMSTTALHVYDSSTMAVDAYHTESKYSDTTWLQIKTRGHEVSIFMNSVEELALLAYQIMEQVNGVVLKQHDKMQKQLREAQDQEEEVPF